MVASKVVAQLLAVAACNASALRPRSAQAPAAAPKPPNFLGPFGDILANLNPNDPIGSLTAALPKARVAKETQLKPTLRQEAKRVNVQYGPYDLAGKGVRIIRMQCAGYL